MSLLPIAMLCLMLLVLQALIASVSPRRHLAINLSIAFVLFNYVLLTGAVMIASEYADNPDKAGDAWATFSAYAGAAAVFDLIMVCLFDWAIHLARNIDAIRHSILRWFGRDVDNPEPVSTGLIDREESPQPTYRFETANGPALRPRRDSLAQVAPVHVDRLSTDDHVISIKGEITDELEVSVLAACRKARDSTRQRVRVELDTHGGIFHAGYLIRDALTELNRHKPVIIHVVGDCESMGIAILCAVPVAQRVSVVHANFLVHRVTTGNGYRNEGTRINDKQLVSDIVAATYVTERSIQKLLRSGQDYSFDAQRALALGFIGSIV